MRFSAEKLRILQAKTQVKNNEIAKKCKVTYATVVNWRKGKCEPTLEHLLTLSEIFKIDWRSLCSKN